LLFLTNLKTKIQVMWVACFNFLFRIREILKWSTDGHVFVYHSDHWLLTECFSSLRR